MRAFWGKIIATVNIKHNIINIVAIYIITLLISALIFYRLIPVILNYPPDIFEVQYDLKYTGFSYAQHSVIIIVLTIFIGTILLLRALRGLENWKDLLTTGDPGHYHEIHRIRKKCLNLPYIIYIIQIGVIFLIYNTTSLFIYIITGGAVSLYVMTGLNILILSFGTLTGIVSLIFSKRIFEKILYETYHGETQEGLRIGLKPKIFLQILPLLIISILLTSLVGYSRLVLEKGDLLFRIYQERLKNEFSQVSEIKNGSQVQEIMIGMKLENKRDTYFLITPEGRIITGDGTSLSPFFVFYMKNFSPLYNGRIYTEAGGEIQGAVIKVQCENKEWLVGVRYQVVTHQLAAFFLVNFIFLLLLNIFVLYYFSKTLSGEISLVAKNLTEIAKGETVNLEMKLPVTSNDEMADLIIAFNKIQELEKANLKAIQENHAILVERERLASLGQLIGGIAHNLRTPIMSISGGIEAVKDLVLEYQESIDDDAVTKEDLHEICKETLSWLDAMKPYCSYMSEIITTVRDQAVQLSTLSTNSFTLEELIKRVEMLMKFEVKKNQCTLNINLATDMSIFIKGELSSLVQVLNNLILNAIQSYEGNGGEIDFSILKEGNEIILMIRDNGVGIPLEIQRRLFKEMVTTKGKKGSGLGLYLSYSNIKGRFGGKMWFDTTEGQGSTFFISIPYVHNRFNEGASS